MKGMLDFLEKAGLVKKDPTDDADAPANALPDSGMAQPVVDLSPGVVPQTLTPALAPGVPLNLDAIYADGGVAPSIYPAERLLRLMDGLSAMDVATRLMAVRAMDAADESWSIEDPLADAAAKAQALASHAAQLKANLQALEDQTQNRLNAIAARQEQVVGDIRKQIAELEALVSRELSRAAADTATQQAELKAAQDQTARELIEMDVVSQRLLSLSGQFGTPTPPTKE